MNKITVIGCVGSSKTTFSIELSKKLGIPLYTIDELYYGANWQKLSQEELKSKIAAVMEGGSWIIDGQYTKLIPMRMEHADTIIFFDYPKRIVLWRIFKRYLSQKFGSGSSVKGNSILFPWHQFGLALHYPRVQVYEIMKAARIGQKIIIFRKPREVEDFLRKL